MHNQGLYNNIKVTCTKIILKHKNTLESLLINVYLDTCSHLNSLNGMAMARVSITSKLQCSKYNNILQGFSFCLKRAKM